MKASNELKLLVKASENMSFEKKKIVMLHSGSDNSLKETFMSNVMD